jgi:hypothetical protein
MQKLAATSRLLKSLAHATSLSVPAAKAGRVNAARPHVNDGNADEHTKSKTWSLLQHQQTQGSWSAS